MTRAEIPTDGAAGRRGSATLVAGAAIAGWLLLAGGCALTSEETGSKDMLFDRDGVDIVTTNSSRQMVMIKDRVSTERFCRGPEPDSSLATSGSVSLTMPFATGAKSVGGQKQQESLALGGRNPAVLITRELLYRACELSMNINADPEKTLAIYREFLEIAEKIAATQTQAGSQAVTSGAPAPGDDKSADGDDKSDDDDDQAAKDKDKGKSEDPKKKK